MVSEVVEVKREDSGSVYTGESDARTNCMLLSDLMPELKAGETRKVRITVEIIETPLEKLRRAHQKWRGDLQASQSERGKLLVAADEFNDAVIEFFASDEGEGV